jgi:hypothetical protein
MIGFATPVTALITTLLLSVALAGCSERSPSEEPSPPDDPAVEQELSNLLVHFTLAEEFVPIQRQVVRTDAVLRTALEQQLLGPTEAEHAEGYFSWFSYQTAGMLNRVSIDSEGHAVVDFEDFSDIIPNASASAGSRILLGELNATVFQFSTVRSVEYHFNGSCEAFFEWLQVPCQTIQRR